MITVKLALADQQPGKSSYLYREYDDSETPRERPVIGAMTIARDVFDAPLPDRIEVTIAPVLP